MRTDGPRPQDRLLDILPVGAARDTEVDRDRVAERAHAWAHVQASALRRRIAREAKAVAMVVAGVHTGEDAHIADPGGGHVLGAAALDKVDFDGERLQELHAPVHRANVLRR